MTDVPCCICDGRCHPNGICLQCPWCLHGCPALVDAECCQNETGRGMNWWHAIKQHLRENDRWVLDEEIAELERRLARLRERRTRI